MKKHPFIIIDGSHYLYRAYHALPPLSNEAGFPTQVMLGTLNMINKLVDHFPTDYMTVIFDPPGKSFRHTIYPEYKANRPPTPDDLKKQFVPTRQIIENMGIPVFSVDLFEADDVIAHLATSAANAGFKVYVVSGDKDLAQLVSERIYLFDPMKFRTLDVNGVYEKYGVYPNQILDYLALKGDSSDNIPGVPGVGEKTAVKWLGIYQSAQNLIEHSSDIKGKIGEKLRDNIPLLRLSKKLATLCTDGIDCDWSQCQTKPLNKDTLRSLYETYGLRHFLNKLTQQTTPKADYQLLQYEADLDQLIVDIQKHGAFSFDLETDSLDCLSASIVGIAISFKAHHGYYLPLQHQSNQAQLDPLLTISKLSPFLESEKIGKYGQNLKFDLQVLKQHGVDLSGILGDSLLAAYVYNSSYNRNSLEALANRYLNLHLESYEQVVGDKKNFSEVTLDKACAYAGSDSDIAYQLNHFFEEKLATQPSLEQLYQNLELPLIYVLAEIESNGVKINIEKIKAYQQEAATSIEAISQSIYELAGETLNLNSSAQLKVLLFEKLQLPIIKKTPKGQPSTDEFVLQQLKNEHPIAEKLLTHRTVSKIKNTYLDILPNFVHPLTGRIHTTYHQTVAITGRLSSVDPNLQNIPVRGLWGKKLRQSFIAPSGHCLLGADYSQIELRIMAHLSGDEALINAFKNQCDIHQQTAAEIFDIPLEKVNSEQRYQAKAINFGLIYGISPFGLAHQIKVDQKQAEAYIEKYFNRYPKVKNYMDAQKEKAQQLGYVETLLGRRIYLPNLKSPKHADRQHALRLAINAPVQGSAADLIKKAMLNVSAYLKGQTDIKLLMQVHDELVFELPKSQAQAAADDIKKHMTTNLIEGLEVPIEVDIKVGSNWDEVH